MKISIVTVSYNSEKTIIDTFESILKQTYRPLQYIVVDGASNDTTMDIIKEYSSKFYNVGIEFIYQSEKDKGISDAFNKGILLANGDVIGLINSDDLLYDGALDCITESYEEGKVIYYGDCIIFSEDETLNQKYLVQPKNNLELLYSKMCLYHPSCFVNKKAYEELGLFDVDLKYCMDRELLLRFFVNGCKFIYIPQPLACYREGGVNQKQYAKNVKEGYDISIKYGVNPVKAYITMYYKLLKNRLWKFIQYIGAEKVFHKKIG